MVLYGRFSWPYYLHSTGYMAKSIPFRKQLCPGAHDKTQRPYYFFNVTKLSRIVGECIMFVIKRFYCDEKNIPI